MSMESLMHCKFLGLAFALGAASLLAQTGPQPAPAPQVWTWDAVKAHFELNNTSLQASRLNIDELKAQEITAHLRPNPDFTLSADGTQIAPSHGVWQPFAGTFVSPGSAISSNVATSADSATKPPSKVLPSASLNSLIRTQSPLQLAQRLRRCPASQSCSSTRAR